MKWEYKTIKVDSKKTFGGVKFDENTFDNILNELGQQGWELVSAVSVNQGWGESKHIVGILKRPIQ
jgi:hypothetical protein